VNLSDSVCQTPGEDDVEPHYRRVLAEMIEAQSYALNIDCKALYEHSAECARLYDQLVKYPPEVRTTVVHLCAAQCHGPNAFWCADYFNHGFGGESRISNLVEGHISDDG
jgi:hypothetical protein